jgi:putative transposase
MTIRAYKQEIVPNAKQRYELNQFFGAGRWAFNFGLEVIGKSYKRRKDKTNYTNVSKLITKLKKTSRYAWLNEIPSDVVSPKLRDLDRAYQNFFAGRAKYPRFRKRKASGSIRFNFDQRHSGKVKAWANGEMVLPKLGKVKLTEKLPAGMPKSITISTDGTGKYYASYGVEQVMKPMQKTGSMVGIDMGSRKLATLSDGGTVENPKFLKGLLKTLRIRQKSLSRKRKGSNRWKQQAKRVAKVHAKIRDSRRDYLHKATTKIVENQDLIVVESLRVKNMARNGRLARTLHDASMSEFVSMLDYKCAWYGKEFIKIGQWYPSSKTCSCCGHKLDGLAPVEFWTCPKCKAEHDRDFNAANNILAEGLRIRAGLSEFKARGESGSGFGQVVERSETRLDEARIVELTESLSGTGLRLA